MSGLRNLFSLRMRVLLVVITSLVVCATSLLILFVSGFADDKGSYFLEYTLSQARSAAESVDYQIDRATLMGKMVGSYVDAGNMSGVAKLFQEGTEKVGLARLLVLNVDKEGVLTKLAGFGDNDGMLAHSLDQLGWDGLRFLNDPILISRAPLMGLAPGSLAVGVLVHGKDGGGTVSVLFLTPEIHVSSSAVEFQVDLIDALGASLLTDRGSEFVLKRTEELEILKPALSGKKPSGARRWFSEGSGYLVAYQQLSSKELYLLCLVSEKVLFAGMWGLSVRAIGMSFGILLFAVGLALLLLNRATESLRAMVKVTEKVREGVFSFRVETKRMGNDEIGALASSFNLMAAKIDDLMSDAVGKVESKYEMETTALVQSEFIQSKPLSTSNLNFSGKSINSKLFGGDWWHYEQFEDHVLIVFGKVHEKGVAAALVIAAIQGGLSAYKNNVKMISIESPQIPLLVNYLNSIIFEAGGGKYRVDCCLALIEMETGETEIVSFGQATPLYCRFEVDPQPEAPKYILDSLPLKKRPPLGGSKSVTAEGETFKLHPGDTVFWHSASLMRVSNSQGEKMSSQKFFAILSELIDSKKGDAAEISTILLQMVQDFMGYKEQTLSEDIVVAVASIPKTARLVEPDLEEAA